MNESVDFFKFWTYLIEHLNKLLCKNWRKSDRYFSLGRYPLSAVEAQWIVSIWNSRVRFLSYVVGSPRFPLLTSKCGKFIMSVRKSNIVLLYGLVICDEVSSESGDIKLFQAPQITLMRSIYNSKFSVSQVEFFLVCITWESTLNFPFFFTNFINID